MERSLVLFHSLLLHVRVVRLLKLAADHIDGGDCADTRCDLLQKKTHLQSSGGVTEVLHTGRSSMKG